MISALDIYNFLDSFAPFSSADSWDNCGILVGSPNTLSEKILVTLDASSDALDTAVSIGAKIILSHHPVIFHPLKSINENSVVARAIRAGITIICAHTNLDYAVGGVNDALAGALDLTDIRPFDYSLSPLPLGRIGKLRTPLSPAEFISFVKEKLSCPTLRVAGSVPEINTVAVSGGSLASSPLKAVSLGADALISGDIKHDVFSSLPPSDILLIDAGHFYTENVVIAPLSKKLADAFPSASFFPFAAPAPFSFF